MAKALDTFDAGPPRRAPRRGRSLLLRALFCFVLLFCAAFGFGLSDRDAATLRSFTTAVGRWQHHPEFRALAVEYSVKGSAALRVRPLLVPGDRVVIAARSCPLLPQRYGLTDTCRVHYESFARGPLSGYLHLSDEQAVHHVVGMVEELGRRCAKRALDGGPDADLRAFLDAFKLDNPVVRDAGAVQSVASLLADTNAAGKPFVYRAVIGPALVPHVRALAGELGFPTDVARMTITQQQVVLDRLDGYVRLRDPELWRTKQVSDFCSGIWAHVFGRNYNLLLEPTLALHGVGRVGVFVLALWAAVRWARTREAIETTAPGSTAHAFAVEGVVVQRPERLSGSGPSASTPAPHRRAGARRRRV